MYYGLNLRIYDRAQLFIASTAGLVFLAIWSFTEASIWFIAPDFVLVFFLLLNPTIKNRAFFVVLIASLLGGIIYYIFNLVALETAQDLLFSTPFVAPRMVDSIREIYSQFGYLGILAQSFSMMSFKIWTHIAVEVGFNAFIYFPLVIISRIVRIYLVATVAASISRFMTVALKKHFVVILAGYCLAAVSLLMLLEQ